MKTIVKALCAAGVMIIAGAAQASNFQITQAGIQDGQHLDETYVLQGFGCAGGNTSPAVAWAAAPTGTKSFAVTLYDPDAPTGSGWWHWVAFNIPAGTTELVKGAGDPAKGLMPAGAVQSRTDFGTPGFGGACPPQGHGPHRYQLKVHALDVDRLPLDENVPAAMVGFYIGVHSLGTAQVTGIYSR